MCHLYRTSFKMDTNASVLRIIGESKENYIQKDKAINQQPYHVRGRNATLKLPVWLAKEPDVAGGTMSFLA